MKAMLVLLHSSSLASPVNWNETVEQMTTRNDRIGADSTGRLMTHVADEGIGDQVAEVALGAPASDSVAVQKDPCRGDLLPRHGLHFFPPWNQRLQNVRSCCR